jgi:hypothetical protein
VLEGSSLQRDGRRVRNDDEVIHLLPGLDVSPRLRIPAR